MINGHPILKGDSMEKITLRKKQGINGNTVRTWGMVFLAAGVIGRGVIQCGMLGVGSVNAQQLLSVIDASAQAMQLASISIVLQAIETCAVPIFAMLLAEGMQHTTDFKAYFIRILKLALAAEIPYNLAMNGSLVHFASRNPVFGLVMCMVMVWLYSKCTLGNAVNKLLYLVITVAAILWCGMLGIEFGAPTVLVTAVMWGLRKNTLYRNFAGAAAAIVCTVFSPFFLAAPMGFMVVHFYNGEKSTTERTVSYLAYPVMLVIAAILGLVL